MSIKLPPVEQVTRPIMWAVYEIATPMYLHGADHAKLVQRITPQSVKGALRFWWRAVHWADYLHAAGGDRKQALRALAEADARLWGAADESIGQGRALIQVRSEVLKKGKGSNVPGYLKGLGLRNAVEALVPGQTFSVEVHFKSEGEQLAQDKAQVRRTLEAFGVFGGLGSRARHGLGSVQLKQLDEVRFDTWQAHKKVIESLLRHGQQAQGSPPYTAFSDRTRSYFICEREQDVLSVVANSLSEYRRLQFSEDADAVLTVAKGGTPPANYPKRAVFGLPHNYFFVDSRIPVQVDGWYAPEREKLRRGSPLFIHVSRFGGESIGVLTLFEADFLPEDRQGRQHLAIQGNKNRKYPVFTPDWRVISDFLMHELQDAERINP